MNDYKFYRSADGDILIKAYDPGTGATIASDLEMLIPNTTDASIEKHMPVATIDDETVTVKVGEVEHPQSEEHHIAFIALVTTAGCQVADLSFEGNAQASFNIAGATPLKVYEYCNKHGLWMAQL